VSVLFADVVDSMRLAEGLDAEEWHRILERVFDILARGVHRFEGHDQPVHRGRRDGALRGSRRPLGPRSASVSRRHLRDGGASRLREHAPDPRPRALRPDGASTRGGGVGKIGDDLRMDYTAQGHCVGLAARMEQLAAPGTVLLTEHTARLVEGFFALADLGLRALKGVSAPVRVFQLRRSAPSAPGSTRRGSGASPA